MKKIFTTLLAVLLLSGTYGVQAQVDARSFPYFLDAQISKIVPGIYNKTNRSIWIPNFDSTISNKYSNKSDVILSAEGLKIVKITQGNAPKSETHIAIDPNDPNVVIGCSNDSRYNNGGVGYRMGAYYTNDGGKTWDNSTTPANLGVYIEKPASGGMTIFDPSMAFDAQGFAYYLYGFAQVGVNSADDEGYNGVFIARSKDKGKTWSEPFPVVTALEDENNAFHDRYWLAIDNNEDSPYKNRVYATWKRFRESPAIVLSAFDATKFDVENYYPSNKVISFSGSQSPVPAVGPNGELYISWQLRTSNMETKSVFTASFDGGKTFNGEKHLQTIKHTGEIDSRSGRMVYNDKQGMRVSSYPAMAVDCSEGPRRGWIYVIQCGGDSKYMPGVYLTVSKDKGNTWEASLKIDKNTDKDRDVFFPAISVDKKTGLVAVMYYSSQDAENNSGLDAYAAVSTDGTNFNNIRLTSESYYIDAPYKVSGQGSGNVYWGDYTGVAVHNNVVYPCFWWNEKPEAGFWNLDVYTSILSPNPNAPIIVAKESKGTYNTISWVNPSKNLFGAPLEDFTSRVYRDGEEIATLDKSITTIKDENVIDGTEYTYSIQTIVDEDIKSEMVSVNIMTGGALEPKNPTDLSFAPNSNGLQLIWTNPEYHIDNSLLHDLNRIDIYVNDVFNTSVNSTVMDAGQLITKQLNLPQESFYRVKILAVSKRNEVYTNSEFSKEIVVYSGKPKSELIDNFDIPENRVPVYTNSTWNTSEAQSKSPNTSITDSPLGNYKNNAVSAIVFAPVTISPSATNLSFAHKAVVDNAGDYAIVLISKDDMKTWETLCSFDQNTYPELWKNNSADEFEWAIENRDISKYINHSIYLKFEVFSNSGLNKDGWYIDDLSIDGSTSNITESRQNLSFDFTISPSIVSEKAGIEFNSSSNSDISIYVYNSMGEQISSRNELASKGVNKFHIETIDLSNGYYFVSIIQNGISATKPLIVNK